MGLLNCILGVWGCLGFSKSNIVRVGYLKFPIDLIKVTISCYIINMNE
jgi:hypothetical protein